MVEEFLIERNYHRQICTRVSGSQRDCSSMNVKFPLPRVVNFKRIYNRLRFAIVIYCNR
jgi:hypothetical protein